jgi:hypothetical protein
MRVSNGFWLITNSKLRDCSKRQLIAMFLPALEEGGKAVRQLTYVDPGRLNDHISPPAKQVSDTFPSPKNPLDFADFSLDAQFSGG